MNTYRVEKIKLKPGKMTVDEYNDARSKATIHYCKGMKEVIAFCGGRPQRVGYGYSGINGNTEYVVEKIY